MSKTETNEVRNVTLKNDGRNWSFWPSVILFFNVGLFYSTFLTDTRWLLLPIIAEILRIIITSKRWLFLYFRASFLRINKSLPIEMIFVRIYALAVIAGFVLSAWPLFGSGFLTIYDDKFLLYFSLAALLMFSSTIHGKVFHVFLFLVILVFSLTFAKMFDFPFLNRTMLLVLVISFIFLIEVFFIKIKIGTRSMPALVNISIIAAYLLCILASLALHFNKNDHDYNAVIRQSGVSALFDYSSNKKIKSFFFLAKPNNAWLSCDGRYLFLSIKHRLSEFLAPFPIWSKDIARLDMESNEFQELSGFTYRGPSPLQFCPEGLDLLCNDITIHMLPQLKVERSLSLYREPFDKASNNGFHIRTDTADQDLRAHWQKSSGLLFLKQDTTQAWTVSNGSMSKHLPKSFKVIYPMERDEILVLLQDDRGRWLLTRYRVNPQTLDFEEVSEPRWLDDVNPEKDDSLFWIEGRDDFIYLSRIPGDLQIRSLDDFHVITRIQVPPGKTSTFTYSPDYNVVFMVSQLPGYIYALDPESLRYRGGVFVGEMAKSLNISYAQPSMAVIMSMAGAFLIDLPKAFHFFDGLDTTEKHPGYFDKSKRFFWGGWF